MAELKDKNEQYSVFLKYEEPSKADRDKSILTLKIIIITFIIVLCFSLISFVIENASNLSALIESATDESLANVKITKKQELSPSKFNFRMLSRYQNILLLGVDSNGPNTLPYSNVRSDSMIIINIDMHTKSINAISIPRDSKVYLAEEHGVQKINSAYALGGIELTKKTIEETFGIRIHNYVIVNSEGIRKLIDSIGGVPIYVDQNLYYNDYSGKLFINLPKGHHTLTGAQAEGYVRFRKDALGDIGRVHRQQKFIKALIEKIKSPEAIRKIPEALKIASLYTRTDLNLYQMSQYAAMAREIDLNKVEFVMLPGEPNKKGMLSYWILDPEKTQKIINRLIYRQVNDIAQDDMSIGIIYAKNKEIEAFALRNELKTSGYKVNCTGSSTQIKESQIIGYNAQIKNDTIKSLQKNVPELAHHEFLHLPVRNYCNNSDLVITLKDDEI